MKKNQIISTPTSSSYSKSNSSNDNMKVMIRIRPPLNRELENSVSFKSIADVTDNTSLGLIEYLGPETTELDLQRELDNNPSLCQVHRFTFDHIFNMDSSQEFVYKTAALPSVNSVLEGYNSTIFAYGQTGTGKTHTMEGFTFDEYNPDRGIVPRTIEDIFQFIESYSNSNTKFIIRASYLQLYNEYITDLLKENAKNLTIREDKKKGIYVDMLSEWIVRSPSDIYALLQQGSSCRATASTMMNDVSSRSHAVFVITVEQLTLMDDGSTHAKIGKLNLVDLAGSERIRITGAMGKQLEESKKINKSLSALGNVINALTDPKGSNHIPYRDSKLTRLLEDSLGGNCKTTMITMISPCHLFFSETLSSLLFAKRAKNIRNRPVINEDLNHRALISQYETQLRNLRCELEEKNLLLKSNEHVILLEQQKRRAEEDKKEVMKALEQASMQYIQEKEAKMTLEKRIKAMNSQMITGGHRQIEELSLFRSALEERQTMLLKEFDNKLKDIEKERCELEEEDKADIEQYKQLLLRQRDILIGFTNKLNDRDETIVQLQKENEAHDKIIRQQENLLDNRLNRLKELESLCQLHSIPLPPYTDSKISLLKKHPESKIYLSHDAEKNMNDYENTPVTMLGSEEKIKELKSIVKEQENEINILKLVSHKFITSSYENDDGHIDIDNIMKKMESAFQLHSKIKELEEEKNAIQQDFNERNELINAQKIENEALYEQNMQLQYAYENAHTSKDMLKGIEMIIKNINGGIQYSIMAIRGELMRICKMSNTNTNINQQIFKEINNNKKDNHSNLRNGNGCNSIGQENYTTNNINQHQHQQQQQQIYSMRSFNKTNTTPMCMNNNNNTTTSSHSDKFISKFINAGR